MNQTEIKETIYKITKVVIYGHLLLEAMDEIKHLKIFRHLLKYKVNQAEVELEKELEKFVNKFVNNDEEFYYNIQNHIDELISKLSSIGFEELPLVNKIIDEYINDRQYWKENLILKFKKLNK